MAIPRSETQAVIDTLRAAQGAVGLRSDWLVADLLEEQARDRPQALSLIYGERRYTWAELNDAASHYAKVALACGVKPGDSCALMVENRPEFLFAFLGLGKIGAIPGLINTQTRDQALAHAVRTTSAAMLWVGEECLEQVNQTQFDHDSAVAVLVIADDELEAAVEPTARGQKFSDVDVSDVAEPDYAALRSGIKNNATCCYMFTSGTTGLPKAALISHAKFLAAGAGHIATLDLSDQDVFYCALPMFHGAALMSLYGAAMQAGGAVVVRRKFSVSRFWQDVKQNKITVFQYVGEVCRYLVNSAEVPEEKNNTLRVIIGSGMGIDVWERFNERFGTDIKVIEGWGATESNGNMTNFDQKPGACGRIPYPEKSHLMLLRYDQGNDELMTDEEGNYIPCQAGEVGEMHCQIQRGNGDPVAPFDGYTSAEATESKRRRNVLEEGDAWFKSGDVFRFDDEGYYYFVDRTGDTFRWKGENVSTTEVAQQLSSYSDIETINIYGVKIPEHEGRACMAAIALRPGCEFNPQAFYNCALEQLPEYARPLFVRILADADMTANFKLRKVRLRDEGFDVERISDPIYGADHGGQTYSLLDNELLNTLTTSRKR